MRNISPKPYSIRINVKNINGEYTSTSVDFTIARFYCDYVCGFQDVKFRSEAEYKKQVQKKVQDMVRENELRTKTDVQKNLLIAIYEKGRETGAAQGVGLPL